MMVQNKSTEEITSKVWSIVDALPHREAISDGDARSWVDEVVHLHGEAAIWHAIRLNGFGGSEIGVLVRNHSGVRADHQASAHDIVAGKLMRKAPTETSGHMTRGHENEEPHSRRFYVKYGADRDLAAFEALKNAQGKRPWMRYSPDDVVQMPVNLLQADDGSFYPSLRENTMQRWLIDYKAPSKIEESDEIAFQYACQLTQGAILCAEAGIALHGMMLSQFDWANWVLKDDVVSWDQSLGELVIDAGDFYWRHVLRGEVPDYVRTKELEGVDAYATSYLKTAKMFADVSALAAAAKDRADDLRKVLLQPLDGKRIAGHKITFGLGSPVLTLGSKNMLDREKTVSLFKEEHLVRCAGAATYDAAELASVLRELNVDLKPFRKYDLDAAKVYALAAELGLDADALVSEQLTLSAAKDVKKQMKEFIEQNYPLSAAVVEREIPLDGENQQEVHPAEAETAEAVPAG